MVALVISYEPKKLWRVDRLWFQRPDADLGGEPYTEVLIRAAADYFQAKPQELGWRIPYTEVTRKVITSVARGGTIYASI